MSKSQTCGLKSHRDCPCWTCTSKNCAGLYGLYAMIHNIGRKDKPNMTHKWGKWESTIISCASDDRFGRLRKCKKCDAEEAFAGGAGSHMVNDEALEDCEALKN